jgi:hypothetical protein
MLNLDNTTLVMVDGCNKDFEINEDIIKKTLSFVNFKNVIHFTSNKSNKSKNSQVINCKELNYQEYQNFCVYEIPLHIESDFALFMQSDGFIVNPKLFDLNFFNYDYIGAPWPSNIFGKHPPIIGNGGFSLRSKKMLKTCLQIPKLNCNEDVEICIYNRFLFYNNDCKYAPVELAKKFSIEMHLDEEHQLSTCFGFHGKSYVPEALKLLEYNTCLSN